MAIKAVSSCFLSVVVFFFTGVTLLYFFTCNLMTAKIRHLTDVIDYNRMSDACVGGLGDNGASTVWLLETKDTFGKVRNLCTAESAARQLPQWCIRSVVFGLLIYKNLDPVFHLFPFAKRNVHAFHHSNHFLFIDCT